MEINGKFLLVSQWLGLCFRHCMLKQERVMKRVSLKQSKMSWESEKD